MTAARPMDELDPPGRTAAVWDGFLARGEVATLGGPWQVGKTTLLMGLLQGLASGTFLGRACAAGTAIVVSPESDHRWADRVRSNPVGGHAHLLARPFAGLPTPAEWAALVAQLDGFDVIAVESASGFRPFRSDPADFLDPLRRRAAAGAAVLVVDHERNVAALAADVRWELRRVGRGGRGPRRRLTATGRRSAEVVYDWAAETPGFRAVHDDAQARFRENWDAVRERLSDRPATQPELLAGWQSDPAAPSGRLLYDWLRRAVAAGLVARTGSGKRGDPFRFALPRPAAPSVLADLPPLPPLRSQGSY